MGNYDQYTPGPQTWPERSRYGVPIQGDIWGGSGDRFFGWDQQPVFMWPGGKPGKSGFNGGGATGGGKKPSKENYASRKAMHDANLAAARARAQARRSGNGSNPSGGVTPGVSDVGMSSSFDTGPGPSLPAFGSPSMARVNSIVNALMRESTNQYVHGNQDLARQQQAALIQNMRAQLGQDRGIQALKALGQVNTQRSISNNASTLAAENAARQQIEQSLNAQGAGTGNTMAGIQAGSGDAYNADLLNNALRLGDQSNNQYMDAMRAAGGQSALENARALRAAYQQGIMQNNRSLQDIRARKPLSRLEVEKQIQDMFLARKLGQAEYTAAGQNVLTSQQGRSLNAAQNSRAERQFKADNKSSKADRDTVMSILYGQQANVQHAQQNPDGTWTTVTDTTPGVGAPTTYEEAIQMLAASGFTGKKWRNLARQIISQRNLQSMQEDIYSRAADVFSDPTPLG